MVDVKICCRIWGICLVSMAIKDRPAGSIFCSLRRRMRDKTQLPPQIILPTTYSSIWFLLNISPIHAIHIAIIMQLKPWESNSQRKHREQLGHRVPFGDTNKSVYRDFYSCPLSDMPELHFDQGTSDPMRCHHNLFAEGSYRCTVEMKILILNRLP